MKLGITQVLHQSWKEFNFQEEMKEDCCDVTAHGWGKGQGGTYGQFCRYELRTLCQIPRGDQGLFSQVIL